MAEFLADNVTKIERKTEIGFGGLKSESLTVKVEFKSSGYTTKISDEDIECIILERLKPI